MNEENLKRLDEFLKEQGCEAALLSNPANITWLTGYAADTDRSGAVGGGPALAWYCRGALTLVLNDWEAPVAAELGVAVVDYAGYSLDGPLVGVAKQSAALKTALVDYASLSGKTAVELDFLPAAHYQQVVKEALPQTTLLPIEGRLAPLRAVKTAAEIALIRSALELSDTAQAELQRQAHPGVSELELWAAVKGRVEAVAGGRTPVLADLVAGQRTGDVGGLPGDYVVQPGDPVMLDFVARRAGYWGDNSAGYFAGSPHPQLEKATRAVLQALDRGRACIRPGLPAGELDAIVRGAVSASGFEPYPHHSGHGLGTNYHEEPRIIPDYPMRLQENMVIVLEPGVYLPGIGGVRFEDAYLITRDGCEILTHHLDDYRS